MFESLTIYGVTLSYVASHLTSTKKNKTKTKKKQQQQQ